MALQGHSVNPLVFEALPSVIHEKGRFLLNWSVLVFALAAFEPQSESPWLSGGAAAALFPRTHLALSVNPASIGLLSGTGFAVSASRPFGFSELDRTAAAGGLTGDRYAVAGLASYSGRMGYHESTLAAGAAFNLRRGAVAGLSVSLHRIAIDGYGSSMAASTDAGLLASPFSGLLLGAAVRGIVATSPASDGLAAVPRTVSAAAGVCPIQGVTVSAGAAVHQYAGREYTMVTSVEAYPGVVFAVSMNTPPVRMGFSFHVSPGPVGVQYGYSTHPDLPSGHAMCLSYGSAGFNPDPLSNGPSSPGASQSPVFPLSVNTATPEELTAVPGIGPSKASAIRNYIDTFGPVDSIDELIEVPGIGPSTLENIRHYLIP